VQEQTFRLLKLAAFRPMWRFSPPPWLASYRNPAALAGKRNALAAPVRAVLREAYLPLGLAALLVVAAGLSGTALAIELGNLEVSGLLLSGLLGASHLGVLLGALVASFAGRRLGTSGLALSGALLCLAGTGALALTPAPTWLLWRCVYGVGLVWVFAACETWIGCQPGANRSLAFAVYMVVNQLGLAMGQFLVPVVSGSFAIAVLLASILNLGIVVIALKHRRIPSRERSPQPRTASKLLPAWILTSGVAAGLFTGAVLNTGPLLASALGHAGWAAHFVAAVLLAGLALQFPAARVARGLGPDRTLAVAGGILSLAGAGLYFNHPGTLGGLMVIGGALGALGFLIYPLACQSALERVVCPEEQRAIPGQLLLCYGAGAAAAPFLAQLVASGTGAAAVIALAGLVAGVSAAHGQRRVPAVRVQL
jgi:MFS family permease